MLTDYGARKPGFWERIKKLALIIPAVLIFLLGLWVLAYLTGQYSSKQKKEVQKMSLREVALRASIEFSVLDAGYIVKTAGREEIYVPELRCLISNVTNAMIENLLLYAYFTRKGEDVCGASFPVMRLKPGEERELTLKCLDSIGFGTVIKGVTLAQTTTEIHYELAAQGKGVYIDLGRGDFGFKLLNQY
jgi:hypothetical protein